MNDSDRFEVNPIFKTFQNATELQPKYSLAFLILFIYLHRCVAGKVGIFIMVSFRTSASRIYPVPTKFLGLCLPFGLEHLTKYCSRGMRMNLYTVRCFAKAIRFGSKYIYQTVPRLLTIWLDLGEDEKTAGTDVFKKLNDVVAKAIKEAPVYKVTFFIFLLRPSVLIYILSVVHGLPTNCVSCGPLKSRSL